LGPIRENGCTPTDGSRIDIADRDVRNARELASILSESRTDFEQQNAELIDVGRSRCA